jgi:hypothetical protein
MNEFEEDEAIDGIWFVIVFAALCSSIYLAIKLNVYCQVGTLLGLCHP